MKKFINCAFKIIFSRTLIVILMILFQMLVLFLSFSWLGKYMNFVLEGMSFLGAFLVIHIINKDEPAEFKMSWIIPICLFPVLGALIYVFVVGSFSSFGLKSKLRECVKATEGLLVTSEETQEAIKECPAQFKGFAHYMEHTAGFPVYHNTAAKYYPLGEDKYKDLLIELKKAKNLQP